MKVDLKNGFGEVIATVEIDEEDYEFVQSLQGSYRKLAIAPSVFLQGGNKLSRLANLLERQRDPDFIGQLRYLDGNTFNLSRSNIVRVKKQESVEQEQRRLAKALEREVKKQQRLAKELERKKINEETVVYKFSNYKADLAAGKAKPMQPTGGNTVANYGEIIDGRLRNKLKP